MVEDAPKLAEPAFRSVVEALAERPIDRRSGRIRPSSGVPCHSFYGLVEADPRAKLPSVSALMIAQNILVVLTKIVEADVGKRYFRAQNLTADTKPEPRDVRHAMTN